HHILIEPNGPSRHLCIGECHTGASHGLSRVGRHEVEAVVLVASGQEHRWQYQGRCSERASGVATAGDRIWASVGSVPFEVLLSGGVDASEGALRPLVLVVASLHHHGFAL